MAAGDRSLRAMISAGVTRGCGCTLEEPSERAGRGEVGVADRVVQRAEPVREGKGTQHADVGAGKANPGEARPLNRLINQPLYSNVGRAEIKRLLLEFGLRKRDDAGRWVILRQKRVNLEFELDSEVDVENSLHKIDVLVAATSSSRTPARRRPFAKRCKICGDRSVQRQPSSEARKRGSSRKCRARSTEHLHPGQPVARSRTTLRSLIGPFRAPATKGPLFCGPFLSQVQSLGSGAPPPRLLHRSSHPCTSAPLPASGSPTPT